MGRYIVCILGGLFLLAALGVAGWEVLAPGPGGEVALRPLGALWYWLDPGSLNLAQAVVERYLLPALWDPVIAGLLRRPALLVFAAPGAVLLALCLLARLWRRRGRGARRGR